MSESLTIAQYRDTWSELQFQEAVVNLAHEHHWRVAHFRPVKQQRRDGSVRWLTPVAADGEGFVDLVCARRGRVPVFMELKAKRGTPSPAQLEWLDALGSYGYLFKPAAWDEIERVLA